MRDSTFTEFVGVSLPTLSRYAYALTGNVHAGEDLVLVQDTLVKLAGRWRHVKRDNGATWQSRPLPLTTGPNWVSTVDGKLVYAGSGTHLVRSTDGGATWAEIPEISGLPDPDNYGLALPDGTTWLPIPSPAP
jgi:photosystem II stability/assembly factor-like uncharacterized protein